MRHCEEIGKGDVKYHGTNAQLLIEKILRERILESMFWKTKCFALSSETFVDRLVDLKAIGGHYSNQKPTDFICLVLKLLELNPEREIVQVFIDEPEFKYMRALGAFYLRLTGSPVDVYKTLEPLLLDKRKLRRRKHGISYPPHIIKI
jgi:pre-mRNA-splicing factor 38A